MPTSLLLGDVAIVLPRTGGMRLTFKVHQMKQRIRLDPQPNIRGSYVEDGDSVHYSEVDDIDRIVGPIPKWHTLTCPFGENGELVNLRGTWFWETTEPVYD